MNYWNLSISQEDKLVDILQNWFDKLEKMTDEEFANTPNEDINLDFTRTEFAPYHIKDVLEEHFGYEKAEDWLVENGWEQDFWIYFTGKQYFGYTPYIYACGMTCECYLCLVE